MSSKRIRLQLIYFFICLILIIAFVLTLPRISIPLFLSYILSLAIMPFVSMLMRLKISKSAAIIILFVAMGFLIGLPMAKLLPILSEEARGIQVLLPRIEQFIFLEYNELVQFIQARTGHTIDNAYIVQLLSKLKDFSSDFALRIPNLLANLTEWFFIVPFFTFFMIRDLRHFKRSFLDLTPNSIFERFYYVLHVFNRQLSNYFFAKLIEAIIVGSLITLGLFIMGVKYSLLLGFLAGISNIVPYLGPFLGAAPTVVFVIAEQGVASPLLGAVILLYSAANIIDIFFVFPFLVSKVINLHPMLVAISVITGSHYMGITGMIISIPLVAAIKLIATEINNEINRGIF